MLRGDGEILAQEVQAKTDNQLRQIGGFFPIYSKNKIPRTKFCWAGRRTQPPPTAIEREKKSFKTSGLSGAQLWQQVCALMI
ncbi:hypothetical protein [Ralstonia pseudosolanacearum]|uniref:hypothetical protein n=1 Tax=Ralstonia pseudosolanacearum TaxID=1310165 RepID=UPI001FF7EF9B|nr:hypothetical protein [Ralstonia pseudosolanacearum]